MNQRPKLVTIWANYGPYHLARVTALEESGFEVYPYSYSNLVPSYEFFKEIPPRHRLINDCPSDSVKSPVSWWRTLRQLWRDKPDLILACGYERPETLAALMYVYARRMARARAAMVMIMMENQFSDRGRSALTEAVKRIYLKLFDGFAVGGTTHVDYLDHLGVQQSKVLTGYDCVDNARIANAAELERKSQASLPYANYFLTLGRLVPKKNTSMIIEAYAVYRNEVQGNTDRWELVIAGDGPTRQQLQEQIIRHNLGSSVHMVGRVDELTDAIRYYAFCKAFVLASNRSEQWGLVVNEAMAAGVPVLVSRQCGCAGDLVKPGVNGFVIDGDSVSELADRLLWIHRNQHQLQSMGQASRTIVDEYSPRKFAEKVARYYWARTAFGMGVKGPGQSPDV